MLIRLPQIEGTEEGRTLAQETTPSGCGAERGGTYPGSKSPAPRRWVPRSVRTCGARVPTPRWRLIAGITGYIALRFRPSFAAGAIAATFHDILVTVSFLSLSGYDLSLNVVAAILTITGYSVNDTIVTFDRVRENLRTMPRAPLRAGRQRRRQPDPGPDDHHGRNDVPGRPGVVLFRRRRPAGVCVYDAGRDRQRNLFDGLHRRGDLDHVEPAVVAAMTCHLLGFRHSIYWSGGKRCGGHRRCIGADGRGRRAPGARRQYRSLRAAHAPP